MEVVIQGPFPSNSHQDFGFDCIKDESKGNAVKLCFLPQSKYHWCGESWSWMWPCPTSTLNSVLMLSTVYYLEIFTEHLLSQALHQVLGKGLRTREEGLCPHRAQLTANSVPQWTVLVSMATNEEYRGCFEHEEERGAATVLGCLAWVESEGWTVVKYKEFENARSNVDVKKSG